MFVQGHDALVPWVRVLDLDTPDGEMQEVPLPEGTTTVAAFWLAAEPDLEGDPRIQITTQGMIVPPTLHRYDPRDGSMVEVMREKPSFDASGMRAELLEARSADGTMVPYHVALPREAANGPVPIVVSAYGGFMIAFPAMYQKFQGPTMLARGIGSAIAHIRGGGEFGPNWHRAALQENRHKAFEDTVAVARDLVARGLAPEGGVGFVGGSNGGLLASVMATRYPEDFGAIKADVPVADMLRFHLYEAGAAWIEEYGDPDDPSGRGLPSLLFARPQRRARERTPHPADPDRCAVATTGPCRHGARAPLRAPAAGGGTGRSPVAPAKRAGTGEERRASARRATYATRAAFFRTIAAKGTLAEGSGTE